MKRVLSVFLSLLTVVLILMPACTVLESYNQRKSVDAFRNKVIELNSEYNSLEAYDTFDKDGKPIYSAYEPRLIALTDKKIKNNADEEYYGLGYAILQYSNKDILNKDLKELKSQGITVGKDYVNYITDFKTEVNDNISINADKIYSLGYCGENYAKEIINATNQNYDDIIVGVIDTGITYDHPIFTNRLDSVNEPNFSPAQSTPDCTDEQGHGTMVSGIIVSSTPDNVKVRIYKVGDIYGRITTSEILAVYEHILAEQNKPNVINMSYGGAEIDSDIIEIMDSLLQRLYDSGITLCAAAGNDSSPSDISYPCRHENVICVSSCNGSGEFSSYSNYGSSVDICAPGEKIYTSDMNGSYNNNNSGTSFSCPFVSAACAYVKMQNPDYTPLQVKDKILSSATYQGADEEFYYGSGILNFADIIDTNKDYSAPTPSIEGGLYHDAISVSFNVPEGTELIYSFSKYGVGMNLSNTYTYNEPIQIDSDCVLHYVLIKDNEYVSNFNSQEYIIQYYTTKSDYSVIAGILRSYKGDKTNIVVPDDISATSIYRGAFENSTVKSIVLPDKITLLGTEAFKNSALRHIVAKGVTKLNGNGVFSGCTDLRSEEMPNLETVTESAFLNCSHLHEIDFGQNITKFKSSMFEGSGLMHGNFPNAEITSNSNNSVFKKCKLLTLNIPKISELGESFLAYNNMLYELNSADIVTMRNSCLYFTHLLTQIDASKVTKLYSGGLAGCAIENFYAPLITALADSGTNFGEYCNCYTVNLPNFNQSLGINTFIRASTKNFYFESVTEFTEAGVFTNTPAIKILYMPNVTNFYGPRKTTASLTDQIYQANGTNYNQYPKPDIIWIPKAETIQNLYLRDKGFVYAPSAMSIQYCNTNENSESIIFVSDKLTADNLTITALNGVTYNTLPAVISSSKSPLNISSDSYRFINVSDCMYTQYINGSFYYDCDGCEAVVPYEFIKDFWNESLINTVPDNSPYLFIFDFTNDNFINAKDYAVFLKK